MSEAAIGNIIARQLARETGLHVQFHSAVAGKRGSSFDGSLTIGTASGSIDLPTEIKRNLRRARIQFLRERMSHEGGWVLLADYLSQPLQAELRANQINYADAAGNAFVNHRQMFILVEGRKNYPEEQPQDMLRPAEIATLFCLLIQPALLAESYRQLEQRLQTSKATLSGLFTLLKDKGYLSGKPGGYSFERCTELLEDIAIPFQDTFKPKLLIQRFRFARANGHETWASWQLPPGSCWGGEAAAFLRDGFLLPEEWTIYTSDSLHEMLRLLPVVPDSEGPISVYRQFWPDTLLPDSSRQTAPDVLIYADLISSGIGRNRQAALQMNLRVC